MRDEPDVDEKAQLFESAMLAKIDAGWLQDNFDVEEALKPGGDVPAAVNFVGSLGGQLSAAEVMAGETNKVKVMLEEQLLVLSEVVVEEVFRRRRTTGAVSSVARQGDGGPMSRRHRSLVVEGATSATVDSVQDVGEWGRMPYSRTRRVFELLLALVAHMLY